MGLLSATGRSPRPAEVVAVARQAGFSRAVVYRARKALEGVVVDTKPKHSPNNRWTLAEGKGR